MKINILNTFTNSLTVSGHFRISYFLILLLTVSFTGLFASETNLVWSTPSHNSSESMPCGGGDIGLNVWVENGDLLFYMGRSGTNDENNTLLKQGRFRIRLSPNPFKSPVDFRQELKLQDGSVEISANGTTVILWVDVFHPVVHVDIQSKHKVSSEIRYENWRYIDRLIRKGESQQNSYKWAPPKGLLMNRDSISSTGNAVTFFHRNSSNTIFDIAVSQQGMESVKSLLLNPLANLTSGGRAWGDNLRFKNTESGTYAGTDYTAWVFESSKPFTKQQFNIALHTGQTPDVETWAKELDKTIAGCSPTSDHKKTIAWWNAFWQRSFIHISGQASTLSQNYTLFRYMLGCNVYGTSPTKFNGGLFTFDPVFVDSTQAYTPDYRKWGGGTFTAQNQRLVYWPMLKSGDYDLMIPQFDFYNRLLKNAELRSKVYWGHSGACFAEQLENFGLPNPSEYGWKRPDYSDKGVEYNAWLEYEWDTVLEFCQMILETRDYNNADISRYRQLIESSVRFFDEHYRYLALHRGRKALDSDGHLILFPASACETYKMANNPASTIAALRTVLKTMGNKDSLLATIPPITLREINGKPMISPAKTWERVNNTEAPQLYPVFPWRIFGVGKDSLQIAKNTYLCDPDVQKFRSHVGWKQDNIFAACLGLTAEAKRLTKLKLASGPYRFPAFCGPGFDWSPDHNWGGSGMIGLQEMLLQTTDQGKILLFPAWPREWNVHFKLHAPKNTTVEAELKNGKVINLIVLPESRKKDIVIMNEDKE
ncbi:MAG: DUF5703 domain-containing protein [Paludibacter sp.]|nr:DUF5703 domain-containing protein [Paludibacter sp.]